MSFFGKLIASAAKSAATSAVKDAEKGVATSAQTSFQNRFFGSPAVLAATQQKIGVPPSVQPYGAPNPYGVPQVPYGVPPQQPYGQQNIPMAGPSYGQVLPQQTQQTQQTQAYGQQQMPPPPPYNQRPQMPLQQQQQTQQQQTYGAPSTTRRSYKGCDCSCPVTGPQNGGSRKKGVKTVTFAKLPKRRQQLQQRGGSELSLVQLRTLARAYDVRGRTKMSKAELVSALQAIDAL